MLLLCLLLLQHLLEQLAAALFTWPLVVLVRVLLRVLAVMLVLG